MNQCWFDVHNFFPVVKRKLSRNTWVHRCLFCCRDYTGEVEAFNCAARCAGERNRLQITEQLLNDLPLPPPQRKTSRLLILARVARPAPQKKALKAVEPLPVAEEKKTEIINLGKKKTDFKKAWVRKGEKYQCPYCRMLHYTKAECETCFGTHFKDDGYEIARSSETPET